MVQGTPDQSKGIVAVLIWGEETRPGRNGLGSPPAIPGLNWFTYNPIKSQIFLACCWVFQWFGLRFWGKHNKLSFSQPARCGSLDFMSICSSAAPLLPLLCPTTLRWSATASRTRLSQARRTRTQNICQTECQNISKCQNMSDGMSDRIPEYGAIRIYVR